MIEDTIARIEERLRRSPNLPSAEQTELQELLRQLRAEAAALPALAEPNDRTQDDDVRGALGQLEESLTEFETSHPQLVGIVNRISTILANMGI